MASQAIRTSPGGPSPAESQRMLERGRQVLAHEIDALGRLTQNLDSSFSAAVGLLLGCRGSVIATGMGKAGIVAQKLAASLSSTGTPSHYLHPADAVHGDSGCLRAEDLVIALSYSGETDEILRLLPLVQHTSGTIAMTARPDSSLGRAAQVTLILGEHREACSLGLAPTTTTTAMMALGDALTIVTSELRGLTREQFAKFHPAGNLGRQLANVREIMRPLEECRVAEQQLSLREVLVQVGRPGRRTGAIMLVDAAGKLVGIFTDSDLARLLERSQEALLDRCIAQVMTSSFTTVGADSRLAEAMQLMASKKISELPVVDECQRPLGMIDVTDLVGVSPLSDTGQAATTLRVWRE